TPPEFRFCLKLPRDLTHSGTLAPAAPGALSFLARMRGLGERLGPSFAQLPPRYAPDRREDLLAFLRAWPRGEAPLALDGRHPAWFRAPHAARLRDALTALGVGWVILDSRPIYEAADRAVACTKPNVPLAPECTAPFRLVRYISHPTPELNLPYLTEWAERV